MEGIISQYSTATRWISHVYLFE